MQELAAFGDCLGSVPSAPTALGARSLSSEVSEPDAIPSAGVHRSRRRADGAIFIDLAWHQKEFQLRSSFDYAVMSLDERRLLGCVYIDPPPASGVDADIWFWARQSELSNGLEDELGRFVAAWLASGWPFKRVTLNGQLRVLSSTAEA